MLKLNKEGDKMQGIDVSNYQGNIDWAKVKASGKDFAIIRAGWGQTNTDPKFKEYIENAIKNGFNIGIYWFIYARSEKDAINNAIKCDSLIAPYKQYINFKVWADWEYDSDNYCKGLDKNTRTQWVKAFCNKIKERGYDVGIYANPDYIKNKFGDISEYPLWLAYYTSSVNSAMAYNPLMWQYSSKGRVNGIGGNVDLDEYYGNFIQVKTEEPKPKTETAPITEVATTTNYKVKSGDTLGAIASKYKTNVDTLMKLNPQIKNRNLIQTGQIIKVPSITSVISNPYKEPIVILKHGSRGEGVKWLQWALKSKGYDLVIDGIFGNCTNNAVLNFQKSVGIQVDGKVGVITRTELKK